ncbi:protein GLUTELIN PRECURSOR ACCUMULATION 3-like isoform X2 [Xenia sp. Carnegie-2017]|uniref:protein GLUTELIN PRECURSOR ACCUMULATION 3-like isoform X2 n=1 Tax=Xenia sp. Carnegie-2017 TaxID=2897299 RepID=UPI001F0339BA|nr:protein GLUTELIN PRECURSOR ACCUMULATION 3-like isoform X2 [Xenia sp. Carnegie-2017]
MAVSWFRIFFHFAMIVYTYAQLQWMNLDSGNASNTPSVRRDMAIGYQREMRRVLIFGGRGNSGPLGDTWEYNLDTRQWKELTTNNAIDKRFSVVSGVWKNGFYVSTGEGENDAFFDDIWRLDLSSLNWTKLPSGSTKPEERYGSAGGFYLNSSLLYLTHGFASNRFSNTFVYDVSKPNEGWREVFEGTNSYNPNYPHARCLHAAAMISQHKMVIYGGCLGGGGSGGPCPADDNWSYDAMRDSWTRLPECASPRKYPGMAILPVDNNTKGEQIVRPVLYGGDEKTIQVITVTEAPANEVVVYYPEKEEWKKKTVDGDPPPKRYSHAMVTVDEGIIMFGGLSSNGLNNDLWLLNGTAKMVDGTKDGDDCKLLYFSFIHLHGIFMFIGWGALLQLGMFFARYFRHREPWWFKMHRIFQVSGLVVSSLGLIFAIISVPFGHFTFAHAIIGLLIMLIGLFQPLNAFFCWKQIIFALTFSRK